MYKKLGNTQMIFLLGRVTENRGIPSFFSTGSLKLVGLIGQLQK